MEKNGEYASVHIKEQAEVLEDLKNRGYSATFAVGFEEAKKFIDRYMSAIGFEEAKRVMDYMRGV